MPKMQKCELQSWTIKRTLKHPLSLCQFHWGHEKATQKLILKAVRASFTASIWLVYFTLGNSATFSWSYTITTVSQKHGPHIHTAANDTVKESYLYTLLGDGNEKALLLTYLTLLIVFLDPASLPFCFSVINLKKSNKIIHWTLVVYTKCNCTYVNYVFILFYF